MGLNGFQLLLDAVVTELLLGTDELDDGRELLDTLLLDTGVLEDTDELMPDEEDGRELLGVAELQPVQPDDTGALEESEELRATDDGLPALDAGALELVAATELPGCRDEPGTAELPGTTELQSHIDEVPLLELLLPVMDEVPLAVVPGPQATRTIAASTTEGTRKRDMATPRRWLQMIPVSLTPMQSYNPGNAFGWNDPKMTKTRDGFSCLWIGAKPRTRKSCR